MTGLGERTAGAALLDLATALALVTAVVYAAGWTYAYHYFGRFGLGLLMLEMPYQYFLMYGFWVFKAWWWLPALLYGFIMVPLLVPALRFRLQWIVLKRPGLWHQAQVLIVVLAFLLAWWMAAASANRFFLAQQHEGFTAYPHVRVWPKKPLPGDPGLRKVYEALPEGGYRLLLQNRGKLFLIKTPRDGQPVRPAVIQLALSEVRALRVLP